MRLIGAAKGQRLCRSISPISDGVPTSKEANNREGGGGVKLIGCWMNVKQTHQ